MVSAPMSWSGESTVRVAVVVDDDIDVVRMDVERG